MEMEQIKQNQIYWLNALATRIFFQFIWAEKTARSKILRTIMQVNKNIFYYIDKDKEYRFICPCNKVWNSNHRLICSTYYVKHLRLFPIRNHETYYSKVSFDVEKYITDIETTKIDIKNLRKIWNKTNYRRYVGQLRATKNKPR